MPLSMTQRAKLIDMHFENDQFSSNTNSTMLALEKRGLVDFEYCGTSVYLPGRGIWSLTEKGREVSKELIDALPDHEKDWRYEYYKKTPNPT